VKSSYKITFCQTQKYHHFYFIMELKVDIFCVSAASLSYPTNQFNRNILLLLRNASHIKKSNTELSWVC